MRPPSALSLPDEPLAIEGAVLRSWQPDDAEQLVAAWRDPDIARFNQVPVDPSISTAERWIDGVDERLRRRHSVDLVVVSDDSELAVGEVGLSRFSQDGSGALVGYWLLPEARGQGFAVAAVSAFVDWAHAELGIEVVVARCHGENAASQRVALGCGFQHEAHDPQGNQLWRKRWQRDVRASSERC